ncbi:MAG: FCD domain-containing protein [Planctomycetaceae bacterium]|nr:FCD domain-containing protein [Planctomycetaceae bacterium]
MYKIGEELPSERDLMDEFQVGRPAIRESLLKLERMGVIETRPGVRARVCEPSVSPLLEEMGNVVDLDLQTREGLKTYQCARSFFENALVRIAAQNIDDQQLEKLRSLLDRQKALGDRLAELTEVDVEFHEVIAAVCGNKLVIALFHNMGKWLVEQRKTTLARPGQPKRAYEAHKRIYDALVAHDPQQAEKAMTEHLQQVEEIYRSIVLPHTDSKE